MSTFSSYKPIFDSIMQGMEDPCPLVRGVAVPPNSELEKDSSWSLSRVSEGFAEVERESRAVKLHPDTVFAFGPDPPYIPYGAAHIARNPGDMAAAGALLQTAFARKDYFVGTRVNENLRRIMQDFVTENPGKFKFYAYPLLLPKSSEGREVAEYYGKCGIATDRADFNARAVRDYYFSIYSWTMIRNFSLVSLSVTAGMMCLTTGADYVGAVDDPGTGGKEAYIAGAIDAMKMTGSRMPALLNEVITVTGFIYHKTDLLARLGYTWSLSFILRIMIANESEFLVI